MEKISFYKFKKETHHKKVRFRWSSSFKTKEWETEKFYINKSGTFGYSLPSFILGLDNKFYKISNNQYKAISENGFTVFTVLD